MQFFATCAKALEPLVAAELRALGAGDVAETRAGVAFSGTLETGYRACLWSRIASRILLPLATVEAPDDGALYDGVRTIRWTEHVGPDDTIAVDANHALKVKDAIVDQIRDETGRRPSVDTDAPDLRINVHEHAGQATVSIDLSGDSLHRRGWRAVGVEAPLKENLAAAILMLADWPARAVAGDPLCDPDVRLGHAADRSRAHGRRRGARPTARALRLSRLARPRRGLVAAAHRRGARAQAAHRQQALRLRPRRARRQDRARQRASRRRRRGDRLPRRQAGGRHATDRRRRASSS